MRRGLGVLAVGVVLALGMPAGASAAANHFVLSSPTDAASGDQFGFTITARNPDNSIDTGYAGTVHFTSNDPAAVLPANQTLTSGSAILNATLSTPGCRRISANDNSNSLIS